MSDVRVDKDGNQFIGRLLPRSVGHGEKELAHLVIDGCDVARAVLVKEPRKRERTVLDETTSEADEHSLFKGWFGRRCDSSGLTVVTTRWWGRQDIRACDPYPDREHDDRVCRLVKGGCVKLGLHGRSHAGAQRSPS